MISIRNIYDDNLERLIIPFSAETLYYPTVSQLVSLAQSRLSKDGKVAVIIGGDSVFHGVGQSARNLWTKELQTQLGNDYRVLNLAMRSGAPQEAGGVTAQALLKLGYKRLIYVADTGINNPGRPDYAQFYKYLFWDAYYQGLLLEDRDRDQYLHNASFEQDDWEMRRLMWLNSHFHFNDFWTFLGYQYVFTVWNSGIANYAPDNKFYWLSPRRIFQDDTDQKVLTMAERYRPNLYMHEMAIVKSYCSLFNLGSKTIEPDRNYWDFGLSEAKIAFPNELKQRTLIVVYYNSPYYRKRLSLKEQQCSSRGVQETQKLYQKTGYFTEIIGQNFNELDYSDRVHFSPTGGYKLAVQIAFKVKQIASELGYFDDQNVDKIQRK